MDDQSQQLAPKPTRRSPHLVIKVIVGLFFLVAVGLSVYLVQQEQDNRQEAFHKRKVTTRPTVTVTPPALPTLAPISEDQAYTLLSQIEIEVENYLDQYRKDVQQAQSVNASFDSQTL